MRTLRYIQTLLLLVATSTSFAFSPTDSLQKNKGSLKGYARSLAIWTDNAEGLKDFRASGITVGLRYETLQWKGFSASISGCVIGNLTNNYDYLVADPKTATSSRYEVGLFDYTNSYQSAYFRLENLQLRYHWEKVKITVGRQSIQTPFVTLQDGFLRPSMVEGVWLTLNPIKRLKLEGGWLWAMGIRGTTQWYSIEKSIGIYPQGTNANGTKGNYYNNVTTNGLLILGANYMFNSNGKLSAWHYYLDNIFQTSFIQLTQDVLLSNQFVLKIGLQGTYQTTINDGGNADLNTAYLQKGTESWIGSGRIGMGRKNSQIIANYSRIIANGRFQSPREWGIEPFFTFMPREGNEGTGDVVAYNVVFAQQLPKQNMSLSIGAGKYQLPDVKNVASNKYGLPSYSQMNIEMQYKFKGSLNGLSTKLWIVKKWNEGNIYGNDRYRFNKTDLTNYNLFLNYAF